MNQALQYVGHRGLSILRTHAHRQSDRYSLLVADLGRLSLNLLRQRDLFRP